MAAEVCVWSSATGERHRFDCAFVIHSAVWPRSDGGDVLARLASNCTAIFDRVRRAGSACKQVHVRVPLAAHEHIRGGFVAGPPASRRQHASRAVRRHPLCLAWPLALSMDESDRLVPFGERAVAVARTAAAHKSAGPLLDLF
jgi:hypothetical protein